MLTNNLFSNCFDAMVEFFKENNQGLESPWSWEDAFQMRHIAFEMLWNNQITHSQYDEFNEAISVPLFDTDAFAERINRRAKAADEMFSKAIPEWFVK
jgi:hypothetical protein